MSSFPEFVSFEKIGRLARGIVVTEKIDGTNAQVYITDDGDFFTGSRNRWITPESDNFGFARWAHGNKEELLKLGPGRHFGEWWGQGIQRTYGLSEKRFSLFNTGRWTAKAVPACVSVVPQLYRGVFNEDAIDNVMWELAGAGSVAAPGFMKPEGIVIYHTATQTMFKKTLENDDVPKGQVSES